MKNIFILGSIIITFSCMKTKINKNEILGDWKAIKGNYEQITFTEKKEQKTFYAYSNGRIAKKGKWEIKGNNILIKLTSGKKNKFSNVFIKNGILTFNDGRENYKKVKSPEEKVNNLMKEISSIKGIKFSTPKNVQFTWNYKDGTKTLNGKLIKTEIVRTTNNYSKFLNTEKKIVNLLLKKGFKISDFNTSEIITSYEKGQIKTLIKLNTPLDMPSERENTAQRKEQKGYIEIIVGIEESHL